MFKQWIEDGVIRTPSGVELRAYANSSGLKVMVPGGSAFVRGHQYNNTELLTLPILGGGSQPRIDSVILHLEYGSVNRISMQIKQGTPGSTPQPAALIQTDTGVYELLLATVFVSANAATINAANVTDERVYSGTRAISKGGTGATTAAGARSALGITPGNIGASPSGHSHSGISGNSGVLAIDGAKNLTYMMDGEYRLVVTPDGTLAVGIVPWARLTGVPTSFTPSGHTHDSGDIKVGVGETITAWVSREFEYKQMRSTAAVSLWEGYVNQSRALKTSRRGDVVVLTGRVSRATGSHLAAGTIASAHRPTETTAVMVSVVSPGNTSGLTFSAEVSAAGVLTLNPLNGDFWSAEALISFNGTWAI
ncbi:hypothetical protein [Cryobacterium zongtaii]|nr:hypothetical protein [Cryobacterium zongtaii]